jgi:insertion element IS1 protein InsB
VVIRFKKQKHCTTGELNIGDGWIGLSLACSSGLILAAGVGKHTDAFIEQLIINTEGKTKCKQLNTDD